MQEERLQREKAETDRLLAAAKLGDRHALEELLTRYQGDVLRFGLKMCGHPEDAQDVLQETMLTAARSISRFRGEAALSTWLYQIARSFCIKKRRRLRHEAEAGGNQETCETETLAHDSENPEEQLAARQLEEALERALSQLDPKYREVFVLRDLEGLSAAETATVLGLQVATVKTRLHRARAQMRALLAPILGHEEKPHRGCPEILRLFSRYLEGELSPSFCSELQAHVSQCKRCAAECEALRSLLAACRSLPQPQVPREVEEAVRAAIRAAG